MDLLGIVVGLGYGYVAQRGAFCLNSGFRDVFATRDTTKVKAFALAVAVQMAVLPPLFMMGVVAPGTPSLFAVGAIIGGLLFGASMRWAAGCAAGVMYKVGGRSTSALVAVFGMATGAAAMEIGPLQATRDLLRGPEVATRAALGLDVTSPGGLLLSVLGLVGIVLLLRTHLTSAGDWTWRRTGASLGLVGVVAWVLSGLAGRNFGLAVIPGAVAAVGGIMGGVGGVPVFDVTLVLGIPLGATIATTAANGAHASFSRVTAKNCLRRLVGGLGLGVGASLAAGCTVGHGLAGLPLLAPGSLVTMLAIFLGANLAPIARALTARIGRTTSHAI